MPKSKLYTSIDPAVAYSNGRFAPDLLVTPDWFQPFWKTLVSRESFGIHNELGFQFKVKVTYERLAPLFDEYMDAINNNERNKIYSIYIKTLIALAASYKTDPTFPDNMAEVIADMQDLDFIAALIKHYVTKSPYQHFGTYPNNLCCAYIKSAAANHKFNAHKFFAWLINEYELNPHFFDLSSIMASFEQCNLDLTVFISIFPKLPEDVANMLCRQAIVHSILNGQTDVADVFLMYLPMQTTAFFADDKGIDLVNAYVFEKYHNPEFAYSWATMSMFDDPALRRKMLVFAAFNGCAQALEYFINIYNGESDDMLMLDQFPAMQQFHAMLAKGVEMNHIPSIKLLATLARTGNDGVKKDLPYALVLYEKIQAYKEMADIYRYDPAKTIHNEFAAFELYNKALDFKQQTLTDEEKSAIVYEIAISHLYSLGTTQDVQQGLEKLRELAVNYNYKRAYEALATVYRTGIAGALPADQAIANNCYVLSGGTKIGAGILNVFTNTTRGLSNISTLVKTGISKPKTAPTRASEQPPL